MQIVPTQLSIIQQQLRSFHLHLLVLHLFNTQTLTTSPQSHLRSTKFYFFTARTAPHSLSQSVTFDQLSFKKVSYSEILHLQQLSLLSLKSILNRLCSLEHSHSLFSPHFNFHNYCFQLKTLSRISPHSLLLALRHFATVIVSLGL